ncbi:MAG TPA: ABC-F family ATP-binding cassette domain-containing protein [Acidimicrobiales bacterium]|nr:ABC-F family ATP-binding cassette domain-containing protein [Acidimicrobiales bacterium]
MLRAVDVAVEVGGRKTVVGASFTVHVGDKVGLVGRNGAGKTSMLKVLAGEAQPVAGSVSRTGALGYLNQDPRRSAHVSAETALQHVLGGRQLDEVVVRMEKLRLRMEEDPSEANVARHARAHDEFERKGGYAAEAEVRRIVAGLGLTADRVDLPLKVLSGGERRRVELARILFGGSDVLLLDEPTNHLDVDAKTWLMGFLRGYRGALLVISHDLELLDEAITRVLHLERDPHADGGSLTEYKGTYSQYRQARALDEKRLAKQAAAQTAEIVRLSTLADKMRGQGGQRTRKAKVLDHRVERLETQRVEGPKAERHISVRLPDPPSAGRVVLEVSDLAKSYGGPTIFEDVSFAIERGERLLVMGLNGAGKTSLLRILAGQTDADLGEFRFGFNVSVGYYAQEHENLRAGTTLLEHIQEHRAGTLSELRGLLGMFGLTGEMAFQDAGTLSGGEKTKLSLALLTAGRHNLLLLDEPTNNLDPPSRAAVGDALASWKGAMVIVSHDPEFVRELRPQRVLLLPDGTLDYMRDDLLDLVALA